MALTLGVSLPDDTSMSFTAGKISGLENERPVKHKDKFPMGSLTKMFTAAAVLRLVDQGSITLDQEALPLMDTIWQKMTSGSSLVEVYGEELRPATVRQLLSHRSGISDEDSWPRQQYQLMNPEVDIDPVMDIVTWGMQGGSRWMCDPKKYKKTSAASTRPRATSSSACFWRSTRGWTAGTRPTCRAPASHTSTSVIPNSPIR